MFETITTLEEINLLNNTTILVEENPKTCEFIGRVVAGREEDEGLMISIADEDGRIFAIAAKYISPLPPQEEVPVVVDPLVIKLKELGIEGEPEYQRSVFNEKNDAIAEYLIDGGVKASVYPDGWAVIVKDEEELFQGDLV